MMIGDCDRFSAASNSFVSRSSPSLSSSLSVMEVSLAGPKK